MIKKILAPTDFSDLAATGVAYAFQLAKELGAELVVMNIIVPDESNYVSSAELQKHKRMLDEFIEENFAGAAAGMRIRKVVEPGTPAPTLVYWAKGETPDLIVMSSHGRTGLARALIGSVTEQVLRNSPCPVLVVPVEGVLNRSGA
jgi:nucleotide-binding universal stress UspA family protein